MEQQNALKEMSFYSLRRARECRDQGNVGRAFLHFLAVLKLNPDMKNPLKEVFHDNLVEWTNRLMNDRRLKDVHTCFTRAIEVFPENELIYCSFGDFLLSNESLELVEEAIKCFRKCVAIDKWNLQAIRKLENSCNIAVERWHFRMLNDKARNEAFRKAIIKRVRDGYSEVLDIGTGTGLLSLFAAEAGATKIYACDSSTAMTQMAKKSLDGKPVEVIEIHSTDLKIPEHIPKRVSLVVCEIMDAGLFGEHVLDTLHHAWANLLQPSGVVIPQNASFHICGISSQHILEKHVLINKPTNFGLENFEILSEEIVYDSENISSLPGGFIELTDTACPLDVNFNNPDDIRKVIEGKKDICVTLRCKRSGVLSCIAGWFSLKLIEGIVIDTHPNSGVKCWDQAIFPCPYLLQVSPNQEINLLISFQNGLTQITFPDVETTKRQIKISQNAISLMNDVKYMKALEFTAQHIPKTNEPCRFLDTSPLPIMALNYFRDNRKKGTLVSTCRAPGDQELVAFVAESMGIDVVFTENFIENEVNSSERFDVIFLSVVDVTGEFNCFYLHQLSEIRNILKPGGILLPQKIQVTGQLVESEWIRRVSRVVNTEVTCNYDIASLINGFVVRHQLDFQLESLNALQRSQPFELFNLNLLVDNKLQKDCNITITEAGQVDAIPFWFNIQFLTAYEQAAASTANSTHFNSAALLFDTQVSDSIRVVSKYENGLFITEIE